RSCGGDDSGGGSAVPGQSGVMNAQYVSWDHLGSTRLVTDEEGVAIASLKYYPFGFEAEVSGGDELRQKFTGHERDDRGGVDYMMARSCRMALARFMEPDEYGGSATPLIPQSWNRYSYVSNSPANSVDPSGYAEKVVNSCPGGGCPTIQAGEEPGTTV